MDEKKCNKMRFKNLKREYLKREYLNEKNKYEKIYSLLEQEVKESLILNH